MRFGLIGGGTETFDLVRALSSNPAHQLVAARRSTDLDRYGIENLPGLRVLDEWEELLADRLVDAVIVGLRRDQPETMEVLRKLASAGIPAIVMHPALSAIDAYEIEMIRANTASPVRAYFRDGEHPMIHRLAALARDPSFNAQQLVVERMNVAADSASILDQLARDAYWITTVAGRIDRVIAVAGSGGSQSLANLGVTLSGPAPIVARWSVVPGRSSVAAHITLAGSREKIVVSVPSDGELWSWLATGQEATCDAAPFDGATQAVDRLVAAIEAKSPDPQWPTVCRCLDVADSAELSARRGRAIELVHEAPTEESSFKGIMAAAGCGVLVLCLLLVFLGSLVEGFRLPLDPASAPATTDVEPAPRLPLAVRLWPVYPLVVFLALQLLRLVARPRRK